MTFWSDQPGCPGDGHWHQSRCLLPAATYGPGDMAELGPTEGPSAPTVWSTTTTHHGEASCRARAPADRGAVVGTGPGVVLAFGMLLGAMAIAAPVLVALGIVGKQAVALEV